MSRRGRWRRSRLSGALGVLAVLAIVMAVAAVPGCTSELTDTARIRLGSRELLVEVADDLAEQTRGLSGRPRPGDRTGMLFVWDEAGIRSFVLSDLNYEIDVVFIGTDRRVVDIAQMGPDGPDEVTGARPARWVLEVQGGWADRHDVEIGSEFEFVEGAF